MTTEEAIKILNEKYIGIGSNDVQVFQLARDALEKRARRKPKKEKVGEFIICKCPNCGYFLGYYFQHDRFCRCCGQALDYSDTK